MRGNYSRMRTHLDEAQDPADAEHPDDPEQGRADRQGGQHVLQQDTRDASEHQDEVEQVPRHREVVAS